MKDEKQLPAETLRPKRTIWISDLILLACDALLAFFAGDWLAEHSFPGSSEPSGTLGYLLLSGVLCIILIYALALFRNLGNIGNLPAQTLLASDNIALAFNSMLISVSVVMLFTTGLGVQNIVFTIILIFVVMGGWFWLHQSVFRAMKKGGQGPLNKGLQISGIAMTIPLAVISLIPMNNTAASFRLMLHELSPAEILWQVPVFTFMLALLAWMMTYIPRRMVRVISGSAYRNKLFLLMLWWEYIFKVFF